MESGAVQGAEDRDVIAAAVASMAGFVDELSAVIVGGSADDSDVVAAADPLQQFAALCLDGLSLIARIEAATAAVKVQLVAGYTAADAALQDPASTAHWTAAQERSLVAEVGCALAIGERAAGAMLAEARALTTSLPRTLAALQSGTISWAHARVMVDQTASLDLAGAAALEAHFLDPETPHRARECPAGEMPAYRFKAKARSWRERHHPQSLEKRHAKSVADRRVEYWPDCDGTAWISMCLPADQASALWNRITAAARGLQGPEESRTLPQLRADVAAGWLLGGTTNEVPSPLSQVLVTVPVFSLMGLTEEPAVLDGHGPIPASMARKLVATGAGSFYRVLVDPRDGAPLEIGRTSYRVSKAMRNWLSLRDGKCPFPGCSNNSLDNEADHILAWHKGGTTGISNLGQPCRKHHKLRHTSGWKPTPAIQHEPPGWTSPSGRHYKSEHQDWEPPHWPLELQPELKRNLRSELGSTRHGPPSGPDDPPKGCPDIAYVGLSLGEEGIDRFLRAGP